MKIAIISDTHGSIEQGIINLIRGTDLCVHAGDIGNAAVLEQLQRLGLQVLAVLGNNDIATKWPAKDVRSLKIIPYQQAVDLPGGQLCVEHGHRILPAKSRHDKLRKKYNNAKAVVYGHSHRMVCDQARFPWILNPGAAGKSRTYGGASCLILTISKNHRWTIKSHRVMQ